jgi:hypothetical protein
MPMQAERGRGGTATTRHYEVGGQHHARTALPLVGIQNAIFPRAHKFHFRCSHRKPPDEVNR